MLGMLINVHAPNAWKIWVDHILKQKATLGLKKATLIHQNGAIASACKGFIFSPQDVLKFNMYMDGTVKDERISLQCKTYIVKSVSEDHIIAFSGSKYIIVHKSKTMYIVALCESRSKLEDAAMWLRKLNNRLIEKDY